MADEELRAEFAGRARLPARDPAPSVEESAALSWRARLPAVRRVHRRPSSKPCAGASGSSPAWLRVPVHHGVSPVKAPAQSAMPDKSHIGKEEVLATDWPCALLRPSEETWRHSRKVKETPRSVEARVTTPSSLSAAGSAALADVGTTLEEQHLPYRWVPTQMRRHTFTDAGATHGSHFVGTFINTLNTKIDVGDATWNEISLAVPNFGPINFRIKQHPSCCLLGGSLVLCKGRVLGTFPSEYNQQEDEDAVIARLPEGMRPSRRLRFAALANEASCRQPGLGGRPGVAPQLVTLVVTPDGWIRGFGKMETRGTIDLSAVRFSLSRGLALVDEVRLHTCDLEGTRLVVLQGVMESKALAGHGTVCLAPLPVACQPQCPLPFAVAGARPGSYHLVFASPSKDHGVGGELTWADSKWDGFDEVNLSGVMFETAADALRHSLDGTPVNPNRKKIAVTDFQNCLIMRYTTIENAWKEAFFGHRSGYINFTMFTNGCKAAAYKGDVSRLWLIMDEDRSGEITFNELAMNVGKLHQTLSLEDAQ